MNIRYNKGISRVHDAMEGLVLSYKENYKQIYKDYNLQVSKTAEEALIFIHDRVVFDIPGSDFLFGRETEAAVTFARSRFIPADVTIDSFVDYLMGLSDEEIKLILLANLNAKGQKKSYEELLPVARDDGKILDFIRDTDLPAAIKWEAMEFFRDIQHVMTGFIGLVRKYIPVYKKLLSQHRKLIETFEQEIESGICAEGKAWFTKTVRDSINLDAEDIIVGILFFRSRSLTCVSAGEKLYVFLGLDYEETVKQFLGEGDPAIILFKNLSDKTRLHILNLLKEKDLYGQEIAEKVGITLATVSYHMNFLLASTLVRLEKVGQKGYYSLQKNTLRKCVDYLIQNFNLNDKKGAYE